MFNFVKYIIALLKGLAVTFKHIFKPPTTDRYPKKKKGDASPLPGVALFNPV